MLLMTTFHIPIPGVRIRDYSYELPDNKIAKYPLPVRHDSKLLLYRDGRVSDHVFVDLPSLLPQESLLVFNNSKVVPARLFSGKKQELSLKYSALSPPLPGSISLPLASTLPARGIVLLAMQKMENRKPSSL